MRSPLGFDHSSKFFLASSEVHLIKERVSSIAEVWECQQTGAKSLHATTKFLPGDILFQIGAREYIDAPNYLSVQIDSDKHILLNPVFLQYINHSCQPNVFFDTSKMIVVCINRIDIQDAITFFYPSTEWSMAQSFDCQCRQHNCLGKIQGARYLAPESLSKYDLNFHIKKAAQRRSSPYPME